MNIEILKVGSYECNCYILSINKKCLIIDPGDEYDKIKSKIGNNTLLGILITHNHFDHVGAVNELVNDYNVKVYDKNNLLEQKYVIDNFKFDVIYNPGHTNDSISFLFDNNLFCGDFIFKDNIGRCDLPTGSSSDMKESILKIKNYSKDIVIYPGHGDITNLFYEIENNSYF